MNFLMKIIAGSAFATVLTFGTSMTSQAADQLLMKPLQGVSFELDSKRAVSYFLNENSTCKLVVTFAEAPDADDVSRFVATRFEATVAAGKATRFNTIGGKSLAFACHASAQVMSVTGLEQVASSPPGR
jgi:hypothetical protein